MTLTEFLLARIAKDEEVARRKIRVPKLAVRVGARQAHNPVERDAKRTLAECEAKRRIVGLYGPLQFGLDYDGNPVPLGGDGPETYWDAIRMLAFVYADHPDYQQEWRP